MSMSLTVANGMGCSWGDSRRPVRGLAGWCAAGPARAEDHAGMKFAQHGLGEREMFGGQLGSPFRVAVDDRLGQLRVLVQRPPADLGAVRLGPEPEADVVPDAQGQLAQVRVLGGRR